MSQQRRGGVLSCEADKGFQEASTQTAAAQALMSAIPQGHPGRWLLDTYTPIQWYSLTPVNVSSLATLRSHTAAEPPPGAMLRTWGRPELSP